MGFAPARRRAASSGDRARAGHVRLLLPSRLTDAPVVRLGGHATTAKMLRGGAHLRVPRTMIHSKTLVVDGKWSVVGSANMDIRSKELNQESVIGILDAGFGAQLEATYEDDLRGAREITATTGANRGPFPRVRERFWEIFAEQM
jgi:cardiolipin synthase